MRRLPGTVFVQPDEVAERHRKAYFVRIEWIESECPLETSILRRSAFRVAAQMARIPCHCFGQSVADDMRGLIFQQTLGLADIRQ